MRSTARGHEAISHMLCFIDDFRHRAVARSENPGGLAVMGGDDVPTLVEIG